MSSQAQNSESQSSNQSVAWTANAIKQLVDLVADQHHNGQAEGGTMKKEKWMAVSRTIGGVTPDQCKSKWGDLKSRFRQWKELEQQSGFGWNESKQLYEASNDVWNALNKSWRNITWHKTHVLEHREQLEQILARSQATGAYAVSASNAVEPPSQLEQGSRKRRASSPGIGHQEKKPTSGAAQAAAEMAETNALWRLSMEQAKEQSIKDREEKALSRLTRSERAIRLVELEYEPRLSVEDALKVYEFMGENDRKAGIFLVLKAGPKRDAWLEQQAEVLLDLPLTDPERNAAEESFTNVALGSEADLEGI